jgi:serine/threonine protein kinase
MCIVMELCRMGSLFHVMNSDIYEIGWDRVFKFSIEMVKGISFLHSQEPPILHRDLKSLNLLVTDSWNVKV